jgi:hypothetical protein
MDCMDNNFLKGNLSDALGKINKNVLQSKLELAIYMLKKGDVDELTRLFNSTDIDLLIDKLQEIDKSTIQQLNLNTSNIKSRITDSDLNKLSQAIGRRGNEVVNKIKEILRYIP